MGLENIFTKDVQIAAVTDFQWGDGGKGKVVDFLVECWADVTAGGTGGNNAGHTVSFNGKTFVSHAIPAGIVGDSSGKITIIGNGKVIEPVSFVEELNELDRNNMTYRNLMLSKDAQVVMPWHIERDKLKNQSQKDGGVGSTGRGIGPSYSDKIARSGILISDLFDQDRLMKKTEKMFAHYESLRRGEFVYQISTADEKTLKDTTKMHRTLGLTISEEKTKELSEKSFSELTDYYKELAFRKINPREKTKNVIDFLKPYIEKMQPFVRDTVSEMHRFVRRGKKILLEGAQGLLLSIEHGTYPYVTSSDCSLNGTATGVGLSAKMIDLPLGVVKFPFMTRVGGGPFPTECGGKRSEIYCAEEHTKLVELTEYGIPYTETNGKINYNPSDPKILELMNSKDDFTQGIGIRLAGNEYGATTGRPRRIGWTDAVAAKYAVGINGPLMVLTKPDVLAGADEFKICYNYGKGKEIIQIITNFSKDESSLRNINSQYKSYRGYNDISNVRNYENLPKRLRQGVEEFENFTGGKVAMISVGADREAMIVR